MIGLKAIFLSSVGGASLTLIVNGLIKQYDKLRNLQKQKKVFVEFIDKIILRYLKTNINQYQAFLDDIDEDEKIYGPRSVTHSPMLNRTIFDFFEKSDLIKIFNYSKNYSIADIYHLFYEIEFLQKKSPIVLLVELKSKMGKHYDEHKKGNEDFLDHVSWCQVARESKEHLKSELTTQKKHSEELLQTFENIKLELNSIEELNSDD